MSTKGQIRLYAFTVVIPTVSGVMITQINLAVGFWIIYVAAIAGFAELTWDLTSRARAGRFQAAILIPTAVLIMIGSAVAWTFGDNQHATETLVRSAAVARFVATSAAFPWIGGGLFGFCASLAVDALVSSRKARQRPASLPVSISAPQTTPSIDVESQRRALREALEQRRTSASLWLEKAEFSFNTTSDGRPEHGILNVRIENVSGADLSNVAVIFEGIEIDGVRTGGYSRTILVDEKSIRRGGAYSFNVLFRMFLKEEGNSPWQINGAGRPGTRLPDKFSMHLSFRTSAKKTDAILDIRLGEGTDVACSISDQYVQRR